MKFFDFFRKYMEKMVGAGAGAAKKWTGSATLVWGVVKRSKINGRCFKRHLK
jgi:hypothetical protein